MIVWPSVEERAPDVASRASSRGRARVGALDGLRGFALVGMLAWHAELDAVRGGFARMTIFFVLSGYLATRSWQRRSREGFPAFWTRRTLRLLPMTLVGVVVAVGVTLLVGSETTRASLTADTLAVLTYTSNFHFLDSGQAYGELFERQSAFQHYWSLSIEEQLFLALPVLLAGVAAAARIVRRPPWQLLLLAGLAVTAGSVVVAPSADALYFGTHTRLIEFLVGAALASWLTSRERPAPAALDEPPATEPPTDEPPATEPPTEPPTTEPPAIEPAVAALRVAGVVSAAIVVATLVLVDRDAAWLYAGWIHAFAVPVALVIAAIELGQPWLHRVLDIRPLVWLGRAALSIYVLHWPLFVLIDAQAPLSWSFTTVVALKLGMALIVGGLAFHHIERPLLDDTRRWLRRGRREAVRARLAPMVVSAVVLGGLVASVPAAERIYDFRAAAAELSRQQAGSITSAGAAAGAPRIAVFGGSTGLMNGLGLMNWGDDEPALAFVPGDSRLGCGLLETGARPDGVDDRGERLWRPVDPDCLGWADDWKQQAAHESVDVALVFFGVWEIADWRLPGEDRSLSILDSELRSVFRERLVAGIDALRLGGVDEVVLMSSPVVGAGQIADAAAARGLPADHEVRTAAYNRLLADIAAQRSDVTVFDYASVVESLPDVGALLPDGVHPTWESATELWSGRAGFELVRHLTATG